MFENIRQDYETHGKSMRDRGLWALVVYRFGVWSRERRFPPWRWLTSKVYGVLNVLSEIVTGVTMTRDVRIGPGLHIIHASTIFIHPRVVIGERCGVMHNVTIGTNMGPDVPELGNDVFVGVGSSILGGVRVGDGARIAANSLVINDVPPGSFVVGVPAKAFRRFAPKKSEPSPEGGGETPPTQA